MKTTKHPLSLYQSADIKMLSLDGHDNTESQDSIVYISGYASVYRTSSGGVQVDRDYETVNTDNLDISSYEKNPILVYNHEWGRVVGKITKIVKDQKGIYVEAEVHRLHGEEAAYEAVKKGLIKSFSIGFIPKEYDILAGDIVQITSAELVEISLAPVQSNPEALFMVTGTKSLGISLLDLAAQNNITTEELKGLCSKQSKGNNLNTSQKNAEVTPAQDPVATPAEPVIEPKPAPVVEPVVTPKVEPKVIPTTPTEPVKDNISINLETLVNAMVEADLKAEAAKEAAKQEVIKKEQEEVNAKVQAQELRVQTAIDYIKERTEAIKNTPAGDIDIEELDSFYELLSTTVETIDGKVKEVVESIKAQSTEA